MVAQFRATKHSTEITITMPPEYGQITDRCLKCHDVDSSAEKLLASPFSDLCLTCHTNKANAVGSKHDFSSNTAVVEARKGVCFACHSPHPQYNLALNVSPLWIRDLATETAFFTQTDSPNYLTKKTLLCYDCHSSDTVDNDPDILSFGSTHTPQDIAFDGDEVGFYDTDPTGTVPPDETSIAAGATTGGHYIKSAGTTAIKRGDKLACSNCHDLHNPEPTNEAFIKNILGGKTVSDLKASTNSRTGTGTGREICTTCHGYGQPGDTSYSPSVSFNDVDGSWGGTATIVYRPITVGDHAPGQTSACTGCHKHNKITAGCDGCHGYAPSIPGYDDTGTRGYAGGIGAHSTHTMQEGYSCITCHGNNGSGPNHGGSVGRTAVLRENVDLVFDSSTTFPGGTTMNNGGASNADTSTPGVTSCQVGCHNPIVWYPANEAPNLNNSVQWSQSNLACAKCHDTHGAAMDRETTQGVTYKSSHRVDTSGRADCLVCHKMANHKTGTIKLINNDTSAIVSWDRSLTSTDTTVFESACLSCHDSDNNQTFSTSQTPPDVETGWSPAAHKTGGTTNGGYSCFGSGAVDGAGCHNNVHGSTTDKMLAEPTATPTIDKLCYKCHTQGKVMNDAISGPSVADDIQQAFSYSEKHPVGSNFTISGKTYNLQCTSCHNPHTVTGKHQQAGDGKSAVTRPVLGDPTGNPRAMGSGIWGAISGQKMNDYKGSGTYEPFGGDSMSATDLPDYVNLCSDCHGTGGMSASDHGQINWAGDVHGKGSAGPPNGGGLIPDWWTAGKAVSWDLDSALDPTGTSWPVITRGKGEQVWTREPYDQVTRIANGNFTLSCTDCHEAHGSAKSSMLRPSLSGDAGNWNTLCNNCHFYYGKWHSGMSCGNAGCHQNNSRLPGTSYPHGIDNGGHGGASRSFDPDLVGSYRFENNLNDSGDWRMHAQSFQPAAALTYSNGKSGKAVNLDGDQAIEIGATDGNWSTDAGYHGTWKYSEMKYNTTIEAWVKPTSTKSDQIIGGKLFGYNDSGYWFTLESVGGKFRAVYHANVSGLSSGQRAAYSSIEIPLNKWTHLAATFDKDGPDQNSGDPSVGRIRIFVNGSDVTWSNPIPGNWLSEPGIGENNMFPTSMHNELDPGSWWGSSFAWGGVQWGTGYRHGLVGQLDEAKLWNVTKPSSYFDAIDAANAPEMVGAKGNTNIIKVIFNEGVYTNVNGTGDLTSTDFVFTDVGGNNPRNIIGVDHTAGSYEATLTLSADNVAEDYGTDTVGSALNSIYDDEGNAASVAALTFSSPTAPTGKTTFQLNETTGSTSVADEASLVIGAPSNPSQTMGSGYFNGNGSTTSPNYIDFGNNKDAFHAETAMTLETRIKPTVVDNSSSSTIQRIFARGTSAEHQISVWRNVNSTWWPVYHPPSAVGSIAFWPKMADAHSTNQYKPVKTDYDNFPIVADHWYKVRLVWNSDKKGGIPGDIFVDDEGTDGSGTAENWSGYRNATDYNQVQNTSATQMWEGDSIQSTGDDTFTIGANVNHTLPYDGKIDWLSWSDQVDYSNVDDEPYTGLKAQSAIAQDTTGGPGIHAGDRVVIRFNGATAGTPVTAANIDTALALSGGHSWRDNLGLGDIGTAIWSTNTYFNDTLTITLSTAVSTPTVAPGDTITFDGSLKDSFGFSIVGNKELIGNFGEAPDGAIAQWKMDETGGTTAYDNAGTNDATVSGAIWTAGQFGNALSFDGIDDYADAGSAIGNFERTDPFTIETWIRFDDTGQYRNIVTRMDDSLPFRGIALFKWSDDKIYFDVVNDLGTSDLIRVVSDTTMATNTWYSLTATYNGSSDASGMKLYLDGQPLATSVGYNALTDTILTSSPWLLGVRGTATGPFKGKLDETLIYNQALSANDVSDRYSGFYP